MLRLFSISALSIAILTGCNATQITSPTAQAVNVLSQELVVSPNDTREYKTMTLQNGIDVILISDPSVEKSAAALSVGVGLLHDPMSQQGMAHYLEHMLFLGTERYPDSKGYSEFMSKNGGAHNAYTWLDITNYMFKVNNDAYDEALDRFSDFFKSPKLYPEYTEKEKNAVNAEWSMRREMDFFGQFKLSRNMMGEHPANRFLIGNLETLGDKEGSNLYQETVDFYNKYYSANIMKLAMISNEPLEKMVEKAQRHFASIENKKIEKPTVSKKLDFNKLAKKRIHYVPNEDVKSLKIDFTIENNAVDFAYKPNYFVTYLLSNEMQGSPAQVLKEQGLISELTASASPDLYGNYGSLSVDIQLTDKGLQNREIIVKTVMQYIDLMKNNGVSDKYFNEIKTSLDNKFKFLEKGDEFGYVSNLADNMQKYPINHAINSSFHYAAFDKKAIESVLTQLSPERLRVWYISKGEPNDKALHFYDGKYSIDDISDDEIKSWSTKSTLALELPSVNTLLPENFDIKTHKTTGEQKVAQVYSDKRTTIWHAPSTAFAHQPKGAIRVLINTPEPSENIKARVALSLWTDLYQIAQSRLITEASVAGMNLRLSSNNGLVLSVGGFTDKQDELLSKALSNLAVSVTEQEFAQAVDRYKRALLNKQKQFPFYQAFDQYGKLVTTGSFGTEALISTASNMTVSDFKAIQSNVLANNLVRVFAFGNYAENDFTQFAKLINSALPESQNVTDYVKAKYWQPEKNQQLVWQQDIDVADVAVVDMVVHPTPGYKQKAQALVLTGHLRTQVFETLRTQEQLAYAVGATSQSIGDYSALGFYIQTPVKGAKAMQTRFDEYKKEYAKQLSTLDEATFAQLKNSVLVSLEEKPKNLSDELSPLLSDWYRERYSYDSKKKLIDAVKQVTLKDLSDYYQQTMLNPNAARLNIQLRGSKFVDEAYSDLPKQTLVKSFDELYKNIKLQK